MRFLCPNCHRELEVPDTAAGTSGTCYHCGAAIVAPAAGGAPAQPAGSSQAPFGGIQPFNIVSEAWRTLWPNFGPIAISFYIAAIAATVLSAIITGPWLVSYMKDASASPGAMAVAPQLPWYLAAATILVYAVLGPLFAGPLFVVDDILTQGSAEMSAAFRGFQRYGEFALFGFLYALPTTICSVFDTLSSPIVPGEVRGWQVASGIATLFMAACFLPAVMEMVDRNADALTAFQASWDFTRGHRWMILLTWIILGLVWLAGLVACCVGYLVTVLILPVGLVLIYRDLRGLSGGAAAPSTYP